MKHIRVRNARDKKCCVQEKKYHQACEYRYMDYVNVKKALSLLIMTSQIQYKIDI